MKVLLINPPLTDVSGPYPATCYLTGFLDTIGVPAVQVDLSLDVVLDLLSPTGLAEIRRELESRPGPPGPYVGSFLNRYEQYESTVLTAVRCLQSRDRGAIERASRPGFFPPVAKAPRHWAELTFYNQQLHERRLGSLTQEQRTRLMQDASPLAPVFGALDTAAAARYQSGLLINDIVGAVREGLDPAFRLRSYEAQLAEDLPTFGPLRDRLEGAPSWIDRRIDRRVTDLIAAHAPDLVAITIPFAGSVHGAFRVARQVKRSASRIPVAIGGGWVNTTLRSLSDPDVFDYVDFVTFDAGERPLQCLVEYLDGRRPITELRRTVVRCEGAVRVIDSPSAGDVPFAQVGTPTYRGLRLTEYLDVQTSLESGLRFATGRWNKLTLAYGCYWKKCAFCDTSLDYIGRFEPAAVATIVDRMRALKAETGESGFHFVDEAMPPALLRRLAEQLVQERLDLAWWGNVRFDAALAGMAPLLAQSGCIALTGGLEVASDRLLALMEKGVSLEQVAMVTTALARAGIKVHAYLIYGFPSQTVQETVDALEYVRQLFSLGSLHSVYWHRFKLTAHSPIAKHPERYGIQIRPRPVQPFANYVLHYDEAEPADHDLLRTGLERATRRYMLQGPDSRPVHEWFGPGVPPTTLPPDFVENLIGRPAPPRRSA